MNETYEPSNFHFWWVRVQKLKPDSVFWKRSHTHFSPLPATVAYRHLT